MSKRKQSSRESVRSVQKVSMEKSMVEKTWGRGVFYVINKRYTMGFLLGVSIVTHVRVHWSGCPDAEKLTDKPPLYVWQFNDFL